MLKETAEILNSNSAMQIRYLEMVQNIVTSGGQKSMFVNLKGKEWLKKESFWGYKKGIIFCDMLL